MPRTEKANAQYDIFKEPDGPDPQEGHSETIDLSTRKRIQGRQETLSILSTPVRNRLHRRGCLSSERAEIGYINKEDMEEPSRRMDRLYWGVKGTAGCNRRMKKRYSFLKQNKA